MGNKANAKEKRSSSNNEGLGMRFFFIFFPEDDSAIITNNDDNKKNSLFFINTSLSSSNSTHLISKAQSTISICAFFIFITLLLFTLSTFEPSTSQHFPSRKHLFSSNNKSNSSFQHALQGMGSLYIKGTRAMNHLIIAHLTESVTVNELKLFSRLFYRSKMASKSDLLFIFPSKSILFENTIAEEHNSFLKIFYSYQKNPTSDFDTTHSKISNKKANESAEPIWGRKIHSNFSEENDITESTRMSYGSVVGFYVDELDPENSLTGFLDNVPMSLRRWACYPMLLGRTRRNFKHIMLVDMKEILLLGDSLSRIKNLSQDSVLVSTVTHSNVLSKHGRKKLENIQSNGKRQASSAIIMGGARGVRRLSNAMLTEIVREALERKKKNSVTESVLFNQLVGNEFILKNVELIFGESIAELSSLTELDKNSASSLMFMSKSSMVRRGNSNVSVTSFFKRYLRSFPLDSTAYGDC